MDIVTHSAKKKMNNILLSVLRLQKQRFHGDYTGARMFPYPSEYSIFLKVWQHRKEYLHFFLFVPLNPRGGLRVCICVCVCVCLCPREWCRHVKAPASFSPFI